MIIYIEPEAREALDTDFTRDIETVSELTYMITTGLLEVPLKDLEEYIRLNIGIYLMGKTPSNNRYIGVVGACLCALLEYVRRTGVKDMAMQLLVGDVISKFYAKVVAPYEDEKIAENGDLEGYAHYPVLSELTPEEEAAVSG